MDKQQYKITNGTLLWRPSVSLMESLYYRSEGFCLACGEIQEYVEPDARRYKCECCGAHKVYGAGELLFFGIYFTDEVTTHG